MNTCYLSQGKTNSSHHGKIFDPVLAMTGVIMSPDRSPPLKIAHRSSETKPALSEDPSKSRSVMRNSSTGSCTDQQARLNAYLHTAPAVFERLIFSDCPSRVEKTEEMKKSIIQLDEKMKAGK